MGFSSCTSAKYTLTQCEGVTFLAFGNGAPDVFSAIAAIGSAKAGDAGLAIGALFGEWLFCGMYLVLDKHTHPHACMHAQMHVCMHT